MKVKENSNHHRPVLKKMHKNENPYHLAAFVLSLFQGVLKPLIGQRNQNKKWSTDHSLSTTPEVMSGNKLEGALPFPPVNGRQ